MAIRFARWYSNIEKALLWGGACLLVYTSAVAQAGRPPQDPSASPKNEDLAVVGCLAGTPGVFQLSDSQGNVYSLTGRTSGLEKYAGDEISVQGTKDESTQTLEISSFKKVFRAPGPRLNSSFSNRSHWGDANKPEVRNQVCSSALPGFHCHVWVVYQLCGRTRDGHTRRARPTQRDLSAHELHRRFFRDFCEPADNEPTELRAVWRAVWSGRPRVSFFPDI